MKKIKTWHKFKIETRAETGRDYRCSECGHVGPVGFVSRNDEGKALKIVCSPQCRDEFEYQLFSIMRTGPSWYYHNL
jgi:hypothetical protein